MTTRKLARPIEDLAEREQPSFDRPRRSWGRRWVTLAVAATLVTAAAVSTVLLRDDADVPTVARTAPIQLPAQVQGLAALAVSADALLSKDWQQRAQVASDGATLIFKTYGSAGPTRTIRVVAARTDVTGKPGFTWAVDEGRLVGKNRCTQNVKLVPRGNAGVRLTVMLCWRTSPTLSAYTLIVDPQHTVKEAEGVAALDQVWNAVVKG
ncbi:MAG TPA: hypothetical protein VLL08_01580 [Kineosporiaceae bacterium]|nr:hypothetical protein [Kineosporiaceae bacterium]